MDEGVIELEGLRILPGYGAKSHRVSRIGLVIDNINRLMGMNITFVTTANTDEEGYALLKAFGLPFKNAKKN